MVWEITFTTLGELPSGVTIFIGQMRILRNGSYAIVVLLVSSFVSTL